MNFQYSLCACSTSLISLHALKMTPCQKLTHLGVLTTLQECILQHIKASDRERRVLTFMYLMNIWCERKTGEGQEEREIKQEKEINKRTETSCKQVRHLFKVWVFHESKTKLLYAGSLSLNSLQAKHWKEVSDKQLERSTNVRDGRTDRQTDRADLKQQNKTTAA